MIKSIQWNFTQICIKMDTIFLNSENSRNSESHVLILAVTNKLDLRLGGKAMKRL